MVMPLQQAKVIYFVRGNISYGCVQCNMGASEWSIRASPPLESTKRKSPPPPPGQEGWILEHDS